MTATIGAVDRGWSGAVGPSTVTVIQVGKVDRSGLPTHAGSAVPKTPSWERVAFSVVTTPCAALAVLILGRNPRAPLLCQHVTDALPSGSDVEHVVEACTHVTSRASFGA